jgi:hypothetical protein
MAWHLHLTEGSDGRWSCSHGRRQLDSHEEFTAALRHLGAYAATLEGFALVVIHKLDGSIEQLGTERAR